jgi:hypothetical protein
MGSIVPAADTLASVADDILEQARRAIRADIAHDVAIASEVILASMEPERAAQTATFLALVATRLAAEPLPPTAHGSGVDEPEMRRMRSQAVGVRAIAELQARGIILPLSGDYQQLSWTVSWRAAVGGGGRSLNLDEGMHFRLAAAYALSLSATRMPAIDSPAIFLEHLPPAMGPKVRRVFREAVDVYHAGQLLAAAVLLGIASEAAWGQLAQATLARTNDESLRKAIDAPLPSASAIQRRTDEVLRGLRSHDRDLNAIDAPEQTYRDLRNYAAHRPSDSFDESRITRASVGTLLDGSVEYFARIYSIVDALSR